MDEVIARLHALDVDGTLDIPGSAVLVDGPDLLAVLAELDRLRTIEQRAKSYVHLGVGKVEREVAAIILNGAQS